jgi:hypothetical protein
MSREKEMAKFRESLLLKAGRSRKRHEKGVGTIDMPKAARNRWESRDAFRDMFKD